MKFKSKLYLKDREGEIRIVRKFLLFPRSFNGSYIKWLEYADIIEKITKIDVGSTCEWNNYAYKWIEVGFKDDCNTINKYNKKPTFCDTFVEQPKCDYCRVPFKEHLGLVGTCKELQELKNKLINEC